MPAIGVDEAWSAARMAQSSVAVVVHAATPRAMLATIRAARPRCRRSWRRLSVRNSPSMDPSHDSLVLDPAVTDPDHSIGVGGDRGIVGDDHDRPQARLGYLPQEVPHV